MMQSRIWWWEKLIAVSPNQKGFQAASAPMMSEVLFQKLIAEETSRSHKGGRVCLVLLIYVTDAQGLIVPMAAEVARQIVAVLSGSLRWTDQIGWYQEGQVIGSILTTLGRESFEINGGTVEGRVDGILKQELAHIVGSLQTKVCRQDWVFKWVGCLGKDVACESRRDAGA